MAHRTNVIQVAEEIRNEQPQREMVTDPVCGKSMERKATRHVLFRGEDTFHFCSKECQATFMSPTYKPQKAA